METTKVIQHTLNFPNGRQAIVSFLPELNVVASYWIEKDGTKTPYGVDFSDLGCQTLRHLDAISQYAIREERSALIAWFEKELQEVA